MRNEPKRMPLAQLRASDFEDRQYTVIVTTRQGTEFRVDEGRYTNYNVFHPTVFDGGSASFKSIALLKQELKKK